MKPKIKEIGPKLRVSPWSENRGGNPYLLVSDAVKTSGQSGGSASQVLNWFYSDELPVLLEPLVKFLAPLLYLFDPRAGFWDRLYLIVIILWTLAIWGFFGACRIRRMPTPRYKDRPQ